MTYVKIKNNKVAIIAKTIIVNEFKLYDSGYLYKVLIKFN